MMQLYEVQVSRNGFGYCVGIVTAASQPILACEAAERQAARDMYGDDWAKVVHQFFAYRVDALDASLPDGWTWDRVESERARWGISDNMVPVATVPGAVVGWGTINSIRHGK